MHREALTLFRSQVFTPRDFVIDTKGVCRLHPELAKAASGFGPSDVCFAKASAVPPLAFAPTTPAAVRRGMESVVMSNQATAGASR